MIDWAEPSKARRVPRGIRFSMLAASIGETLPPSIRGRVHCATSTICRAGRGKRAPSRDMKLSFTSSMVDQSDLPLMRGNRKLNGILFTANPSKQNVNGVGGKI